MTEIIKLDFIKIKNITGIDNVKRANRQVTHWEKNQYIWSTKKLIQFLKRQQVIKKNEQKK